MKRALTCSKAQQLIEDAFDDALDEKCRLDLDTHMTECPECQRYCRSAATKALENNQRRSGGSHGAEATSIAQRASEPPSARATCRG